MPASATEVLLPQSGKIGFAENSLPAFSSQGLVSRCTDVDVHLGGNSKW